MNENQRRSRALSRASTSLAGVMSPVSSPTKSWWTYSRWRRLAAADNGGAAGKVYGRALQPAQCVALWGYAALGHRLRALV